MPNLLCKTALRYVVFGLFIVFSAVTASVAVWNHTFLQELSDSKRRGSAIKIDLFLVFAGASGLFVAFTILFTELARRKAFTSRLWFELSWITLYLLMELAGAIATSVVIRQETCGIVGGDRMGCTSTKTLMVFTWLTVFLLLSYTLVLMVQVHVLLGGSKRHSWVQSVHSLHMNPRETNAGRTSKTVASRQTHPPPYNGMYAYRSGLSPDYQIEHFEPPTKRETVTDTNRTPTFREPRPPSALHTHPGFSASQNRHSHNAARIEDSLDAAMVQLTSPRPNDMSLTPNLSRLSGDIPVKWHQPPVKRPLPSSSHVHRPRPGGPRTKLV